MNCDNTTPKICGVCFFYPTRCKRGRFLTHTEDVTHWSVDDQVEGFCMFCRQPTEWTRDGWWMHPDCHRIGLRYISLEELHRKAYFYDHTDWGELLKLGFIDPSKITEHKDKMHADARDAFIAKYGPPPWIPEEVKEEWY